MIYRDPDYESYPIYEKMDSATDFIIFKEGIGLKQYKPERVSEDLYSSKEEALKEYMQGGVEWVDV